MTSRNHGMVPHSESDPFAERAETLATRRVQLLGARIRFDSNSRELVRLVDLAYNGLPRHRLSAKSPELRIKLLLTSPRHAVTRPEPPSLEMFHGAGLLGRAAKTSQLPARPPPSPACGPPPGTAIARIVPWSRSARRLDKSVQLRGRVSTGPCCTRGGIPPN